MGPQTSWTAVERNSWKSFAAPSLPMMHHCSLFSSNMRGVGRRTWELSQHKRPSPEFTDSREPLGSQCGALVHTRQHRDLIYWFIDLLRYKFSLMLMWEWTTNPAFQGFFFCCLWTSFLWILKAFYSNFKWNFIKFHQKSERKKNPWGNIMSALWSRWYHDEVQSAFFNCFAAVWCRKSFLSKERDVFFIIRLLYTHNHVPLLSLMETMRNIMHKKIPRFI